MVGIYLSGTGNTKHCTEKLIWFFDSSAESILRAKLPDEKFDNVCQWATWASIVFAEKEISEHLSVLIATNVLFRT